MTAALAVPLPAGGTSAGLYPHASRSPFLSRPARPRRRGGLFGTRSSVSVPLEHRIPKGLGHVLALSFFAAVGVAGFVLGGYGASFRETYGEPRHAFARAAGLGIDKVTISGIAELNQEEILAAAGINAKMSLAFLDASDVRAKLEAMPLIKSASVRKLYPNELAIALTERQPTALWQKNGELFVVAGDGTVIDRMRDVRFARLPFVVGDGAAARSQEYVDILEAAGSFKSHIRAGTLVGGRRWTLKLDSGIDLKLPERGAKEALARFAAIEREQRLTEKDILSIDMRSPDRIVVRQTVEAAGDRAEALKKKPKPAKGSAEI